MIRLFLATLAVLLGGCTVSRSLQLAQPVGLGNTDVSFEAGADYLAWQVYPNADLALRHGLSDNVDFTFRSGSSGVEGGLKRSFGFKSLPNLWLALDGRFALTAPIVDGDPSMRATLGGVAQWSPHQRVHVLLAPNVTVQTISREQILVKICLEETDCLFGPPRSNASQAWAILPIVNVGVGYEVHPSLRVILEASAPLHPALFRELSPMGLSAFSGGLAVQWRTLAPR